MGVIYAIKSPSNKVYVGKTYNLRKRIAAHMHIARKGSSIILHNSIRKYGWDAHELFILECIPDEKLNDMEMFWIRRLNTYCQNNQMGLNMTLGGDGQRSSWMHKTELRKWFSNKFTGEGNPFYGKKHSEETKNGMSENAKIRNKKDGRLVPKWGVEKGWGVVRKVVVAYDSTGHFIGEYISLTECAKRLGVNIGSIKDSAIYGSWIGGKFMVKYKTEDYSLKIEVGDIKKQTVKRPVVYLFNSYQIVYPSAIEASKELGVPKTSINRAACYNKLKPLRSGHVFIYQDLLEAV